MSNVVARNPAITANLASSAYIEQLLSAVQDDESPLKFSLHDFYNSGRKSVRIGRHCANDVRLDCEKIPQLLANFHAFIEYKVIDGAGMYILGDKRGVNGTYINRIIMKSGETRQIHHGTVISFGGPMRVVRDNQLLKNPFRFVFYEYNPYEVLSRTMTLPDQSENSEDLDTLRTAENNDNDARIKKIFEIMCCAVCTETCVDPHSLSCGHVFCGKCIFTWIDSPAAGCLNCPTCRARIDFEPVHNVALEEIVDLNIQPHISLQHKQRRESKKQESLRLKQNIKKKFNRNRREERATFSDRLIDMIMSSLSTDTTASASQSSVANITVSQFVRENNTRRGGRQIFTISRRQDPLVTYTQQFRECATCQALIDRNAQPVCYVDQSVSNTHPMWHHLDCYLAVNPSWTGTDAQIDNGLSMGDREYVQNQFARRQSLFPSAVQTDSHDS
eukprot:gene3113-3946_t